MHPMHADQVSRSLAFWFRRRWFFKVCTIYGHGGHLGHVTGTIWTNFRSSIQRRLHMKFGFNRPSGFRGDVWKCWHIYIRTTEAYLYYKLSRVKWTEPISSVEDFSSLWRHILSAILDNVISGRTCWMMSHPLPLKQPWKILALKKGNRIKIHSSQSQMKVEASKRLTVPLRFKSDKG